MRNNLVRIPLTILLVWLGWLGFKQAVGVFFDESDWSDAYLRSSAVIVDSERRIGISKTSGPTLYSCRLIAEYEFEGKNYREWLIWLNMPSKKYPPEDCGKARYGEQVPVWIGRSGNDPMLLQPENRNSKPMTAGVNLIQGLLFFSLAGLLWRRKKRSD